MFTVPDLGDRQRTVYVDPYTARVRGTLTTWWGSTPLTTWLDDLHRTLRLGAFGRYYSEVAASWLWVVAAGGLLLWLARVRRTRPTGRAGRARRVLLPDLRASGRRRTLGWHGATGVWLLVGLLFLSATGLTWSRHAGAHFRSALDATHGHAPTLDTELPTAHAAPTTTSPTTPLAPGATDSSSGAAAASTGHHHSSSGATALPGTDPADRVLAAARAAGLSGPVDIELPAEAGTAWTVTQTDRRWPMRLDAVAVDPRPTATTAASAEGGGARVTAHTRWSDYPLAAKLTKLGVAAHMGLLFGLANQILLAALALGLVCVLIWGLRMWWQRRPTRAQQPDRQRLLGPPPARGAWRDLPTPLLAAGILATVVLGWALPVFGVTLAAFLLLDVTLGLTRRAHHHPR